MERKPRGDPNLPRHGGGFKRQGFLGPIPVGDGEVATEYSIGVPIWGEETEIPSLVPTLDSAELESLRSAAAAGEGPPESVQSKAIKHAQLRMALGLSPFAGDNESPIPTRPAGPWKDEYVYENPSSARLNKTIAGIQLAGLQLK